MSAVLKVFRLEGSYIFRLLYRGNLSVFFAAIVIGALGSALEALSILSLGPLLKAIHDGATSIAALGRSIPLSVAFPMLAAVIPIKIGLMLLSKYLPTKVATGTNTIARKRILNNLVWADARWQGRLNIADTIKRVDDGVYWTTAAFQHNTQIISSALSLGVLFCIMMWISPIMSLASLVFFSLMHIFTRKLNRKLANNFSEISKDTSAFYENVSDIALAFPVVRTFDAVAYFKNLAGYRIESLQKNEARVCYNIGMLGYTTEFFSFIFLLFNFFFLWSGWFAISFSAFMVFFYTAYRSIQSLKEITNETGNLIKCRQHAALVDTMLNSFPEITSKDRGLRPHFRRTIEVHNLTYAYSKGGKVLRGVDMTIRTGEKIAIIGESGCGKSTLLSILMGMTDPTSGSIKVDGKEILPRSNLSDLGLFIPQEPHVFRLSIAENVAMAPDFDPMRVEDVLRQANLGTLLDELPQGIHTRIGEGGKGLSVGQKQRLAIARTLYRDFELLFMDEPNSALDAENSSQVMREIFTLFRKKTIVIVTHDDSLLPYFDRVLMLKDGKLLPPHLHAVRTVAGDPSVLSGSIPIR
ncbi:MAG: ABC transporter ATP-binding protein [Fibrobacteria bacterium]